MSATRMTIGGFTQPGVARNIIEMPSNSEKGLSHRFIWIFPKPIYAKFATLEAVDKVFMDKISKYPSTSPHTTSPLGWGGMSWQPLKWHSLLHAWNHLKWD